MRPGEAPVEPSSRLRRWAICFWFCGSFEMGFPVKMEHTKKQTAAWVFPPEAGKRPTGGPRRAPRTCLHTGGAAGGRPALSPSSPPPSESRLRATGPRRREEGLRSTRPAASPVPAATAACSPPRKRAVERPHAGGALTLSPWRAPLAAPEGPLRARVPTRLVRQPGR